MDFNALHQEYFDRTSRRDIPECWSSTSTDEGCVTSAHYLASAAGAQMLKAGGNAIDAAIATSLALGVCEPAGSGLGGMTSMVIYQAQSGMIHALQVPCTAPTMATPEKVALQDRYRGYAATAIPSNPAALDFAHKHLGTLPLEALFAPAILIATEGFRVTHSFHNLLIQSLEWLSAGSAGNTFLKNGQPFAVGATIRQPHLARTLTRLSQQGFEDFYLGETAELIARDMQANGGFITLDDLKNLPAPQLKSPIAGLLDNQVIHTLGPPAGGMALVQMAQLISASRHSTFDLDSPQDVVLLANLIQLARTERRRFRLKFASDSPGDAATLIDLKYNIELFSKHLPFADEPGETSHVSIVDKWGNAVAMTQSIERSFGASTITEQLGFCYNGYMRAFKVQNQRHPHFLRPGVPARSNASPTIVTTDGKPTAILGSTGSERMASGILTTLLALGTQSAFEAVHQPRLHCNPEKLLTFEAQRFSEPVRAALANAGYVLDPTDAYSFRMGGLQLISINGSRITGVADPRRDGAAICG
jgi:gamma-glutamyltranspeptidase / glutathione hydrolase